MAENSKNSNSNYPLVLIFDIAVDYFCMYIAALLKFNVLKRKNQALKNALTEKQQKKYSNPIGTSEWEATSTSAKRTWMVCRENKDVTEEEQEAILASACAFVEHGLIITPSITIQLKDTCSQQDLMYFVCSAFFNMGKKRSDITSFLYKVVPYIFQQERVY